jgi:hypothetical protein
MNKWGVYSGLAILMIILAVVTVKYDPESQDEPLLSIRQAVDIFAEKGFYLTRTIDLNTEEINEVKPATFFINNTQNKLCIYQYKSIYQRTIASEIVSKNEVTKFFYSTPNHAKNLLFAIIPADEIKPTEEDMKLILGLSYAIFENLNDTSEIVYKGTGDNWESQTTVKYYEYFYHDGDDMLRHEGYHKESTLLKYLGNDIESVGTISYEEQSSSGGGSGTGRVLNPDGTLRLSSSSGNGAMLRADDEITFTIRWNDREETFVARSIP